MSRYKKSVLILGNMNSNGFILNAWLSHSNYDITVFTFQGDSHWEKFRFLGYDVKLENPSNLGIKNFFGFLSKKFKNYLLNYDKIIGMEMAPMLCYFHNVELHAFIPYGGDIRWLTNYKRIFKSKSIKSFATDFFITFMQTRGIRNCKNVFLRKMNENVYPERIYKAFNPKHFTTLNLTPRYFENKFDIRVSNSKLINLICPCRHKWSDERKPSDKGQDIIINGVRDFLQKYNYHNFIINFFEYGDDVQKSKDLINKNNISKFFNWIPKTTQDKVFDLILDSDLVLLEGNNSCEWNSCHAQAIIAHKPFIAYLDNSTSHDIYKTSLNLKFDSFEDLFNKFILNIDSFNKEVNIRYDFLRETYKESLSEIVSVLDL